MRNVLTFAFACVVAVSAFAQAPVLDGTIKPGEYAFVETKNGITLAVSLSKDESTLYMAVSGQTGGWVAFGAGSARMNGSYMVFGFQMPDGTGAVTEETGKGYSHSVNPKSIATAIVTEKDGITVLEASFPAAGFVKAGKLDAIAAIGSRDDRTSLHRARAVFSIGF